MHWQHPFARGRNGAAATENVLIRTAFFVAVVALVLTPIAALAQAGTWPAGDKISPRITQHQAMKQLPPGVSATQRKKELRELGLSANRLDAEECALYVTSRLSDAEIAALASQGITVNPEVWIPPVPGQHPYGFQLAVVDYTSLDAVRADTRFVFLESTEFESVPYNNLAAAMINADDVKSGNGTTARDGTGIKVAIADSGMDPTHADLPTPVEQYDMTDGTTTANWGTSVTNTVSPHGTHVTGTAVGRGTLSGGTYEGMAPGASLYFYKIGNDTNGRASGTDEIEAINRAATVGCDIFSMSYGGVSTYQDGSGPVAQAIDAAVVGGMVCFVSAGNDQGSGDHYSTNVAPNTTTSTFGYTINNNSGSTLNSGINVGVQWIDGGAVGNISLSITNLGSGESLSSPATGSSSRGTEAAWYTFTPNLSNGSSKTYNFTLQNTATSGSTPLVHVTIGGAGSFDSPDPNYTIRYPALADNAIAVAAWTQRRNWTNFQGLNYQYTGLTVNTLAPFSSLGPRIDGVLKPDLAAPGAATISARDSGTNINTSNPLAGDPTLTIDNDGVNLDGSGPADYYVMQGTSMAAPCAAGATALLLEADPSLTPAEVYTALTSTAANAGAPNNNSGYGLIDILSAVNSLDTTPPDITCPSPDTLVVECESPDGVPASNTDVAAWLASAFATDNVDTDVDIEDDSPDPFPMGVTAVTFTATDDATNSSQCTAYVNVVDTTPPDIHCPDMITVECVDTCGVPATDESLSDWFDGFTATDVCDDDLETNIDNPDCFPDGTTQVIFTAMDHSGNAAACTTSVTVEDTTPPEITVVWNRDVLWPPNHKMADITATTFEVTDICDPDPYWELYSVESDEPDNGKGDGNTVGDIADADIHGEDTAFQLRSERDGRQDGRCYTIIYMASDESGNTAYDTTCVSVPHDMGHPAMAAAGFSGDGTGFAPGAHTFTVVIPSTEAEYEVKGNHQILVKPAVAAGEIDVSRAYVGNTAGVVRPFKSVVTDVNNDGLDDVALFYNAPPVADIEAASQPLADGEMSTDYIWDGPIGLHFTGQDGSPFLVGDIFALGEPIVVADRDGGDVDPKNDKGDQPIGLTQDAVSFDTDLASIYPNPFNPETTVRFTLAERGDVTIAVYDVRGALVRTLVEGSFAAGEHSAHWSGHDDQGRAVSSGVYFARMVVGDFVKTRKMVMLK